MLPATFVAVAALGFTGPDITVTVGEPPVPAGAVRLGSMRFRGGYALRLAYSPDGRRLATSGFATSAAFDAATGRRLLTVRDSYWRQDDGALGFGPAGELVVAWRPRPRGRAADELVRIDVETGRILSRTRPLDFRTYRALSPDGRRVASVAGTAADTEVVVDDVAAGKELWRVKVPAADAVGFAADGSGVIAWAQGAGPVRLFAADTGRPTGAVVFDPNRGPWRLALASAAGPVVTMNWPEVGFSVRTPGVEKPLFAGETEGGDLDPLLAPDGKRAVLASGASYEVWDAIGWKKLAGFDAWDGLGVTLSAVSPDGTTLARGGQHGGVVLYDLMTGKRLPRSADPAGDVDWLYYLPDGRLAAKDSIRRWVAWDVKTGKGATIAEPPPPPGDHYHTEARPVGPAGGRQITVSNLTTGELAAEFPVDGVVNGGLVSPDGKRMLATRFGKAEGAPHDWDEYWLGLYDTATGRLIRKAQTSERCEFAPDGKRYAVAYGQDVVLSDAATGAEVKRLPADGVSHLAFRPDGRQLATVGSAGVLVWDLPR